MAQAPASPPRPRRPVHHSAPATAPHKVRIIGGLWKRTPLTVVDGPGVRPTPDRVRETVFNWLAHQYGGSLDGLAVLDLFAGSGALGFEAASRGARRVVLIENNAAAVRHLRAAQDRLKATMVEVHQADARAALRTMVAKGDRFDLVFLDPPYGAGWLQRCLPALPALLEPGACVYLEAESPLGEIFAAVPDLLDPWEILKADKAGQVFYHLLRCKI